MCESCGCSQTETVTLEIHEGILAGNERQAAHNREHLRARGTLAINLMGSPGSGKTALLEATAARLGGSLRLGAMSGDLATERDAERLRRAGVPSVGITTGSACHLDAELVHRALHAPDLADVDLLFIENVGNLVCPAVFDLGQAANVVVLSVTEGEDKPLKYPVMFQRADLVVLTKTDLLAHLPGVEAGTIGENLERVAPGVPLVAVAALAGEGLDGWLRWLEGLRAGREHQEPIEAMGVSARR